MISQLFKLLCQLDGAHTTANAEFTLIAVIPPLPVSRYYDQKPSLHFVFAFLL
jgi:hypothetical protein